jgi:hypothetical protein
MAPAAPSSKLASRPDPVVTTGAFTAVDAARLALHRHEVVLTRTQVRVADAALRGWCRDQRFPTARRLGTDLGGRSPSTALSSFPHLIDIQAEVIRREWRHLDQEWFGAPVGDGVSWLEAHARNLAALERTCLRLPSLVTAAVLDAQAHRRRPALDRLVVVHALAALADAGGDLPGRQELTRMLVEIVDASRPALR